MRRLLQGLVVIAGCIASVGISALDDKSASLGKLRYNATENAVTGVYNVDDRTLEFSSREVKSSYFDVVVEFGSITLTALIDKYSGTAMLDGFETSTAKNTYLATGDRKFLEKFDRRVAKELPGANLAFIQLQHVVSIWSEYPIALDLKNPVVAEALISVRSLCDRVGQPVSATHDDFSNDRGDDVSTLDMAYVSPPAWGECQQADNTWFHNGSWSCFEPDHDPNIEKARGNCFGNCGPGCSSSGLQMTQDCHDHDQCVRNGHDITSVWCQDEFNKAIDDELNAPDCSVLAQAADIDAGDIPQKRSGLVDDPKKLPKPSWKRDKLKHIKSMLESEIGAGKERLQRLLYSDDESDILKQEIYLIRKKLLVSTIRQQLGELEALVSAGDDPKSLQMDAKLKRKRALERIEALTEEISDLAVRVVGMQRERQRLEEIIGELERVQSDVHR